ncbi:uncharacterized protein B0H64DRAFT_368915 [Chaetomium fimeti]|uniref:Uncharacterized protein n=1 Tax=Chaetomium fimeti TaxID=1854472 RepID=A0AAE0LMG9_9PEZI|nr:hypothetical protein B0H64DRAFT_368915 [Chaetomium fimeti]
MAEYSFDKWKPLLQKFEAVRCEIAEHTLSTGLGNIRRWFPEPLERQAYRNWKYTRDRAACRARLREEEFVRQVDSISFFNNKVCDELLEAMNTFRFSVVVPMGFDGNIIYRLMVEVPSLPAHPREVPATVHSSDLLLRCCFLGVNLTVQPRAVSCRDSTFGPIPHPDLSTASTRPGRGDNTDGPGFVCFQLGTLEYSRRRKSRRGPWTDGESDLPDSRWKNTGFVAVARLSPSGRTDGIYAIYNMFMLREAYDPDEDDEDEDDAYDEYSGDDAVMGPHPYSGLPSAYSLGENAGRLFWCAKLGPNLSSFGKDHQMVWTEKTEHPVEVVRVKKHSKTHQILRTTVDEKIWPSAVVGDQTST